VASPADCSRVEFTQCQARIDVRNSAFGVNMNVLHPRNVDHQTVVGNRKACSIVPTGTNRYRKTLHNGKVKCFDHVVCVDAIRDQSRAPVDHPVPNAAHLIVPRIRRKDHLSTNGLLKLRNGPAFEGSHCGQRSLVTSPPRMRVDAGRANAFTAGSMAGWSCARPHLSRYSQLVPVEGKRLAELGPSAHTHTPAHFLQRQTRSRVPRRKFPVDSRAQRRKKPVRAFFGGFLGGPSWVRTRDLMLIKHAL
jgi:hypothetical protein